MVLTVDSMLPELVERIRAEGFDDARVLDSARGVSDALDAVPARIQAPYDLAHGLLHLLDGLETAAVVDDALDVRLRVAGASMNVAPSSQFCSYSASVASSRSVQCGSAHSQANSVLPASNCCAFSAMRCSPPEEGLGSGSVAFSSKVCISPTLLVRLLGGQRHRLPPGYARPMEGGRSRSSASPPCCASARRLTPRVRRRSPRQPRRRLQSAARPATS